MPVKFGLLPIPVPARADVDACGGGCGSGASDAAGGAAEVVSVGMRFPFAKTMTFEQIVSFWGSENLRRWPRKSVSCIAIPEESKRFLTEVGFPYKEDWTLRFDPGADDLPPIPDKPWYRRIGFDYVVPICMDEVRNGCVVAVETDEGGPERFVNSSVEHFGEFLTHYGEYRHSARTISETELLQSAIPLIEKKLRSADPSAFDDVENYWRVIIEQMKDGLL
jgi:hypothetical protein